MTTPPDKNPFTMLKRSALTAHQFHNLAGWAEIFVWRNPGIIMRAAGSF
jgi:hypothetical protein